MRGYDPTYVPAIGSHKVSLEFDFNSAEDVDAMYANLVAAGAPSYFAPVSWNDGAVRYVIVVDPDDNQISLRWPLVS